MLDRLLIYPDTTSPHHGWISGDKFRIPCAVGRGGIGIKGGEGDGITPIGSWPMRALWYRPDRGPVPETGLPLRPISPNDGWCDDPDHALYNQAIQRPFAAGHEEMWRTDHAYDLVVVLGFNDAPICPGGGSAIFWHLAQPDWRPTAGCVATDRAAMLWLLAQCHRGTEMVIVDHDTAL